MIYSSRYLRLTIPNMQGPDIVDLQQRLQEKHYYQGPADGIFGAATNDAVKTFQSENGLPVDGVVGPDTWQALGISYQPQKSGNERIVIDLDARRLQLTRHGTIIKTWPVAVGKPDTPTPIGNWLIVQKSVLAPPGIFGTRWMRLSIPWGSYGIHGTNNPNSIGSQSSHGCIRLLNRDVEELYDLVQPGTSVSIIGQAFTGPILKLGDRGDAVREVQTKLQVLGYYRGDVDGVFGQNTLQAVEQFQSDEDLVVDGQVSVLTYNKLQESWDIAMGVVEP